MEAKVLRVAAVIVAYRSAAAVAECLAALAAQERPPDETVVVDNSADDEVAAAAGAAGAAYLPDPANPGYGAGCEAGLKATTAEAVLFLNPDALPAPGAVAALAGALAGDPRLGAVAAFVVDPAEGPEERGGALNPFGTTVRGHENDPTRTFYPSGAAFMARRSAWVDVGGMDPDLFLYAEDVNLGWRLRLRGWRVRREPAARADHSPHGSQPGGPGPRARFLQERNRLLNYAALTPWHTQWGYLPWLLLHEAARAVSLCLKSRLPHLVRAWAHVLLSQRFIAAKRGAWRAGRTTRDEALQGLFAPVWGRRPSRWDGLLAWGRDRAVRPLRGWAAWGWLLLPLWWLGAWTGHGLWPDEVFTLRLTGMPAAEAWATLAADVHPPLYFMLEWLAARVVEPGPARLVPVALAWLAGRVLVRSPSPGVRAAGAFVWLLPFTFFMGTHLRYYSLAAFLFAWLVREGSHTIPCAVRRWAGALLCYSTHLGPPALLLSAWLAPRRARRAALGDAVVSLVWWLPGLALLLAQAAGLGGERAVGSIAEGVLKALYTAYTLPVGHYTWPDPVTPLVLFTAAALLLALAGVDRRGWELVKRYKVSVLLFALVLTWGVQIGMAYAPTRLSFLVVPLALLLGHQWRAAAESPLRPWAGGLLLLALVPGHLATAAGTGWFHCGYERPTADPVIGRVWPVEEPRLAYSFSRARGAGRLAVDREYGSPHRLPDDFPWVGPDGSDRPVFAFEEVGEGQAERWGPFAAAAGEAGFRETGRGPLYARPPSHRWLLDALDRARGQEPQASCWEWVLYEPVPGL